MKVSLLSLVALVLASAPSAWAAGGLGSACDASTPCGDFMECSSGFCTLIQSTDGSQTIPANGACQLFDLQHQCIKDYFCNPLSNTCESSTVQSCTMTDFGTPGNGCKPNQWCTPINDANSASGAPGACITVSSDPNTNVCNPACPTGQSCALGICVADFGCNPACTSGKICVANVCIDDTTTGSVCTATTDCSTGKSCIAGICVADASGCPTAGCPTGQSCVSGACVADTNSCPAAGCGTGKSCVAGVCVADSIPTCPAAGCGTGQTCIAGVCVPTSVVPATCAADKPCTVTGQSCVAGFCVPSTGAQNVCSPACTTGNTCIGTVCVADGTAFTGTLGSRCDTAHGCNTNLACFAGFCVPSNLAAQAGAASAVQATVSVLVSLAIACVAALMTV